MPELVDVHVTLRRLRPKKIITKSVAHAIANPSNILFDTFTCHAASRPARSSWM